MRFPARGLYAIADARIVPRARLPAFVASVLRGGAGLLQYRDKEGTFRQRTQYGSALLKICREFHIPCIINDDPELCAHIGADGVHLGILDPEPAAARELLGRKVFIGVSCYADLDRALAAQAAGADYVAFGSFFSSSSKPHAVRAPLQLLRVARRRLSLPIAAIGGITATNGGLLTKAGADLLAVIGELATAAEPEAAAASYRPLFSLPTDLSHRPARPAPTVP